MLTLTENAVTIINKLTARFEDRATAGLRIGAIDAPPGLQAEIASAPMRGDQIIEDHGAKVFLDAVASPGLAEKELDALLDEGSARFTLRSRR